MAFTLANMDNWFSVEGYVFKVGHEMLETVNQMTYQSNNSITRTLDGTATNISDQEYYTQPSVKVGFKFISAEDFLLLSQILHYKQEMSVSYYDKDFNAIVTHECYAHPTELKNFFTYGTSIEGVRDLELTFVATLKDRAKYTVTVKDSTNTTILKKYENILWGRSVLLEQVTADTDTFKYVMPNGKELTYKANQRITVFGNMTLTKNA